MKTKDPEKSGRGMSKEQECGLMVGSRDEVKLSIVPLLSVKASE